MKYLLRGILVVVLLPLTYVLLAVLLGVMPVNRSYDTAVSGGVELFIRSSGVHTDFVMPIRSASINWHSYFPATQFRRVNPATMTHIAFGWGDRAFYLETPTWADLKASTVVQALFLKSSSAMHVTYLRNPKPSAHVKRVVITQHQYDRLVGYIISSFEQKPNGTFDWVSGSGYGISDTFYTAKGSYSLFKTCNDWTGKGLREIGVKTGVWTPFAQSVLYYL